jgi:hypothetical protein
LQPAPVIVSKRIDFVPPVQGIILIDCWQIKDHAPEVQQAAVHFYQNLIDRCQQFKSGCIIIDTIIADDQHRLDQAFVDKFGSTPIQHKSDLSDLIVNFSNIQHWYVAGLSWDLCVHKNSIGLDNLSQLTKSNKVYFYSDFFSFFKIDGQRVLGKDFEHDSLPWELLPGFGYQLK